MILKNNFFLFRPEGEERYIGVTQFEPTDARHAWDEPAIKATFDISLIVPKNGVALCNMVMTFELFSFCDCHFIISVSLSFSLLCPNRLTEQTTSFISSSLTVLPSCRPIW